MDYLKKIKEEYPFLEPYSGDLDWEDKAYSFLREKKYCSAEELFKKLCISEPEHHSGLEGMAYISYVHGEYEKAQWFMNEALQRARAFLKDDTIDPTIIEEMELRERCMQARDDLEVGDIQLYPGEVKDLYSQDTETWLVIAHEAGLERRYQMVMSILDQPLPFEVSDQKEEDDDEGFISGKGTLEQRLQVLLFELYMDLAEMKEMDQCRQMLETYRSRHPELYRKEHTFFDKHLIKQAFFRGEPERVKEYLNFLQEEPLEGISELNFTLEMYLFYGLNEQAEELARFLYRCLQESPNPDDDGREFLHVSYLNVMENVYHRLQKGEELTREDLSETLQEFDFHPDMAILEDVLLQLSPGHDGEKVKTLLENEAGFNHHQIMRLLHWQFCKYMLEQKEMRFAASDISLGFLGGVFGDAEGSPKEISARYFTLRPKKIIPYLIEIAGILSVHLHKAGAVLWIAPYFYDFLWETGVIEEDQHQKTQEEIRELKKGFVQDYPSKLWEIDFVHSWPPAHSDLEEERAQEKERFKKSFLLSVKKKNLGDDMTSDEELDDRSQSLHAKYFDIVKKDRAREEEKQSFDKDLHEAQKKNLKKKRQKKKEAKKQKQKQRKKKKKK